jgi:hypothetical protein
MSVEASWLAQAAAGAPAQLALLGRQALQAAQAAAHAAPSLLLDLRWLLALCVTVWFTQQARDCT